jgi:hypothetical protein
VVVGAEVLEERYSAEFPDVAALIAEAPDAPSREAFRLMLERRGEVDAWYSLRVGWRLEDGGRDEVTYVLRPYHNDYHFPLVLRLAREGRMELGVDRDVERGLWHDDAFASAAPLAAAIMDRAPRREAREASRARPSASPTRP